MFAKFRSFFEIMTLFLVILVLDACSAVSYPVIAPGDVLPVATNTTLFGMRQAVTGASNTFVMVKDQLTMLIWPMSGCKGFGFVVLDTGQKMFLDQWQYVSGKGNITSGTDMKALTDYLTNSAGWKAIPAASLTEGVKSTILATGGQQTWVTLASRIPVFMVIFDSPTTDPFFTVRITQQ